MKSQGTWISSQSWKHNNSGGLTFSDFKTF
jgi:hypothetical protein